MLDENYTVADAQTLREVTILLKQACDKVITLPVKEMKSQEMQTVKLMLDSIVVSLHLRGMEPLETR